MQKTKYEGIVKEREGVLLNVDNEALKQYKANKQRIQKMNQLEEDVAELKHTLNTRLNDIETLLRTLVK